MSPIAISRAVFVDGPREDGRVYVGIRCRQMPTDGYVTFCFPGPSGGACIPPAAIADRAPGAEAGAATQGRVLAELTHRF
jgi:hypothetical protein